MKIRTILTEILILTLAISILPMIIATFFSLRNTQNITRDLIYQYQDTMIANLQETEVARVKSLAKEIDILLSSYIATLINTSNFLSTIPGDILTDTVQSLNMETDNIFSIVDPEENPVIMNAVSEHGILIEHLDLYEDYQDIYSFFCFYKVLQIKDKQEDSILKLCVNLQNNFDIIFAQELRQSSVFVVDQNGFTVYHSDSKIMMGREYLGNLEVVIAALTGRGSGSINYFDQNKEQIFGAFANVDIYNLNWGIISQSPLKYALFHVKRLEEESNVQISILIYISLLILLITILSVAIVSYIFAKRISNPIMIFDQKAESIANGDYSQTIEIKSRNEIGRLANTFNQMIQKIKEYIVQLEKAAEDNEELFFQSIQALASSIDAKDPYTKGHSERVTRFSIAIAYSLGLPSHVIKKVKISALLHDVGKIGVPDHILQKPGILNDEEYRQMQKHPIYGASIMESITKLHGIIPGMKHHHEKYDGTGYPDKISGDLIPLEARIIAIADTFDAMTTDRPYQDRMEPDEVLSKIIQWAGSKYDPKIVKAFETAYHESLRRLFYEKQ